MYLAEKLDQQPRYAIYYSPEARTPLWSLGTGWIGRDALSDQTMEPRHRVAVSELERQALTAIPAHYGLHATLKAPFELRAGHTYDDLRQRLLGFCADRVRFTLPPLILKNMDDFVALVPGRHCEQLNVLAQDCVEQFDEFRQPMSVHELNIRKGEPMTRQQYDLLLRWGYPYVMQAFRFHITLSNRTIRNQCDKVMRGLAPGLKQVNAKGVQFDGLCLFYQETRNQPFLLLERFPFV